MTDLIQRAKWRELAKRFGKAYKNADAEGYVRVRQQDLLLFSFALETMLDETAQNRAAETRPK
jgi:hypothetical protein